MNIINSNVDFKILHDKYVSAKPFPHAVIDNFFEENIAQELSAAFPDPKDNFWYEYNNPLEKKLAYNKPDHIPKSIMNAINYLNSQEFLKNMTILSGIDNLIHDPELHGGGMHCIRSGGKLDIHLDYSIHPHLNLERRLNLIVYLTKDWKEEYGGALELWNSTVTKCVDKIIPLFNRAVIFNTGDISYHGHPDPLKCPESITRKSIALYYLTKPRVNVTQRYRAKFVGRPQDKNNEELEKIRKLREGNETAKEVYHL